MLTGKRIILRAIEMNDLEIMLKWRNDPAVYKYFFENEPLSMEMQKRWLDNYFKGNDKLWIIETIKDKKPIGMVGLNNIDWRNRKTEYGRFLIYPKEYKNKGYGTEALGIAVRYAFDHMNMNRLYCEVFADNRTAISIYMKYGFKEEGLFRQYVFKEGEYKDVVYLSLLKDDYLIEN